MEKLKDELLQLPLERSGCWALNRYLYQVHYAISLAIDTYLKGSDFVILIEFHEDIALLDSSVEPTTISLYQVKTKDRAIAWSLTELTKEENGQKSYLSKMYNNYCKMYELDSEGLYFISNIGIKTKLKNADVNSLNVRELCFTDLEDSQKQLICDSIKKQLNLSTDIQVDSFLKFHRFIPLDRQEETIKGMLSRFIENKFPNKPYILTPIYNELVREILNKSSCEEEFTSFERLLEKKSITKQTIQALMDEVGIDINYDQIITEVVNRFNAEGVSPYVIKKVKKHLRDLQLLKMNPNNEDINDVLKQAKSLVDGFSEEYTSLGEMIKELYHAYPDDLKSSHEEWLLKASLLRQLYVDD